MLVLWLILVYFCSVLRQNFCLIIVQVKKPGHVRLREDLFHVNYLYYGTVLYSEHPCQ